MDTAPILAKYQKQGARIETKGRVKLTTKQDVALWYTPGVGTIASYLAKHPKDARTLSVKKNSVAIISDGSAVLGLGNIGPYGALPVMEGKALLFKTLAGIDAWPIVLDTPAFVKTAAGTARPAQAEIDFIVETVKAIAPAFGGINIEDIAAPNCFAIEQRLISALRIPVMHDDQHGTAIVVLAGLINAAKVVKKEMAKLTVVISGAGAAGTAVAKLLRAAGVRHITLLDRQGAIYMGRPNLTPHKAELASFTNRTRVIGGLAEALAGADVFIGVSGKGLLKPDYIALMAPRAIVFALANPEPEILPDEAMRAGAVVVATGRSDFPNQINNALAFPGVFRGALDAGIARITEQAKLRAARGLAALIPHPTAAKIIPDLLDPRVVAAVARAVR